MKLKNLAAGYSIFVGLSMIGMWTMFCVTVGIPELSTRPIEIEFHITAEIITAILLIVGGWGLIKREKWGVQIYSLSMGML